MPTRRRLLLAPIAGALAPAAARAAEDDPGAAIRKVLDAQVAAWNRKDLDAFLEGYWKSPKVVFQSGSKRFDGFDAMRDRYRATYQAEGKEMGTLAFADVEVVPLSADAAMVRGRFKLTTTDGKNPGGIYTLVLRKFPEGWRIVHDHTST